MKVKHCRNVHNISVYKKPVFVAVAYVLKFPLTCNGKKELAFFVISLQVFFGKSFLEMFVE